MNASLCGAELRDQIVVTLGLAPNGFVQVACEGDLTRRFRGFAASVNQVSRALSELIRAGIVVRSRREMQGPDDNDRPITFFLAASPVPSHVVRY